MVNNGNNCTNGSNCNKTVTMVIIVNKDNKKVTMIINGNRYVHMV